MPKPRFAIILYTVREPAKEDLAGTLKRVREIGFEYVQWSGMPAMEADVARAALDAAGLKAIAAHCGVEPFEKDFDAQVAFWKTVGATDVAPGGMMGDCKETHDDWVSGAVRLEALALKLRDVGMRLSYHNHASEFEKYPGDEKCKLDLLYQEAPHLCAELDLAWVYHGGADPATYLKRYAGRCPVIHVKDLKAEKNEEGRPIFTPLGQGVLEWEGILSAVQEAGVEWCVYEQDSCEGDIFDAVAASYDFLSRKLG